MLMVYCLELFSNFKNIFPNLILSSLLLIIIVIRLYHWIQIIFDRLDLANMKCWLKIGMFTFTIVYCKLLFTFVFCTYQFHLTFSFQAFSFKCLKGHIKMTANIVFPNNSRNSISHTRNMGRYALSLFEILISIHLIPINK